MNEIEEMLNKDIPVVFSYNTFEEEGIDWYEIWSDLEHYDIFDEYARSEN